MTVVTLQSEVVALVVDIDVCFPLPSLSEVAFSPHVPDSKITGLAGDQLGDLRRGVGPQHDARCLYVADRELVIGVEHKSLGPICLR